MLLRKVLPLATLSLLSVCFLSADAIDPFSDYDYPVPYAGDLFVAAAPICFEAGGHSDCLDDATLLSGSLADAYNSGPSDFESDSLSGVMIMDLIVDGLDEGVWEIAYDMSTVDDRTSPGSFGEFPDFMTEFDASGNMGVLGNVELRNDPNQKPAAGQATINPAPGGFQITSFFDVFTDISLDSGNSWIPSGSGQTELDLAPAPEPDTSLLALAGIISLAVFVRPRRQTLIGRAPGKPAMKAWLRDHDCTPFRRYFRNR